MNLSYKLAARTSYESNSLNKQHVRALRRTLTHTHTHTDARSHTHRHTHPHRHALTHAEKRAHTHTQRETHTHTHGMTYAQVFQQQLHDFITVWQDVGHQRSAQITHQPHRSQTHLHTHTHTHTRISLIGAENTTYNCSSNLNTPYGVVTLHLEQVQGLIHKPHGHLFLETCMSCRVLQYPVWPHVTVRSAHTG